MTDINNKVSTQRYPRLSKFFQHWKGHNHPSSAITPSSLYLACQTNDLARVKSCLKTMKYEEINYQYPPLNETALHVATRNQHKEIIQMLLSYDVRRSISNVDGQQAYELAETKEIEDLFKRPQSFRFIFQHKPNNDTASSDQPTIKCKICSLVNDISFYEWELTDQNAAEKSLRFRHEFKSSTSMSRKDLKKKLNTIRKGYGNTRLRDSFSTNNTKVFNLFQCALVKQEPDYIIAAYTTSQELSKLLNKDMARNIIHDLKNGCSQFSCDCLYSTEDGTKAIISILFRYEKYQKLSFIGKIYRGIVLPKNTLDHYKVGSCIITTTLLSTSTDPDVAQVYADEDISDLDKQSYFCIYEITDDNSTAIDISNLSEFKSEAEILILPYSAFLITQIEQEEERTLIYLKQQCFTDILNTNS
ncbi:unnamed protein product [Adineta steineri]|uniref:NAD(P)(+)--arginine ADP-ribosyltransferase n=1 Tax=Adineta steineri TaxID=433720 RepID=A0A814YGN3_9BILA|nr:unnamed protein product [Adineta steineri]